MTSLRHMSTPALEHLRRDGGCRLGVVIPVGAVEQHGALLPVTCDLDIAEGAAAALAAGVSGRSGYQAWAAPGVPYGPVPGAHLTAGTAAVSFDAMGAYLRAVVEGFAQTGTWSFVVVVNAHGHNHGRVIEASSQVFATVKVPVVVVQIYEFAHAALELGLTPGAHAGEFEIAAHAYYAGHSLPEVSIAASPAPRPRPTGIYGLDVAPRSFGGIIAPEPPSRARALAAAPALGARLDQLMLARVMNDLDVFFTHWSQPASE